MSDEVWNLWNKPFVGLDSDGETSPQLTVHLAPIPMGAESLSVQAAAIALASDHEGRQVAQWLNAVGIHALCCDIGLARDITATSVELTVKGPSAWCVFTQQRSAWTQPVWVCWGFLQVDTWR